MDLQDFSFLDPDPMGVKYQPKTAKKKMFTLKTQIWTIEKWQIIKTFWFLNALESFA